MARWPFMLKRDAESGADLVDVLLLSTYDTDGAGKFTHQLSQALQELGYTTRVVCVRKHSDDPNTRGLLDGRRWQQIYHRLVSEFDRRVFRTRPDYVFIHMRDMADRTVLRSPVWPDGCKLIVCTFLSGMMSPAALLQLHQQYGNPPVVFYGVDMNFYTAGCHYARSCTAYQRDCAACPAVPAYVQRRVQRAFSAKESCYQHIGDHVVVSSSHEHHQQIMGSRLLGGADVRRILMAVDCDLFGAFEADRLQLKKAYGLRGRVVMLRSSSEPRKGCDMFIDAIRAMIAEDANSVAGMSIVAIGDQYVAERLDGINVHLYSPGYIQDEKELARLYASADLFLNTSLADGGPVMLAQALMSGTPVITTDVGLARDLVQPPLNGRILEYPSDGPLARSLTHLCNSSDEELMQMRMKTRQLALERLSPKEYLRALSGLVKELIGER